MNSYLSQVGLNLFLDPNTAAIEHGLTFSFFYLIVFFIVIFYIVAFLVVVFVISSLDNNKSTRPSLDLRSPSAGKFLSGIDGVNDTTEVCQTFFTWAKEIVKENGAPSANMHSVTFAMANWATEKGLFEYDL